MTSIIENLTELTTTTPDEDKQFLNEVIQEIKVKRGRGRPRLFTPEEAKERIKAYDRKRYYDDPDKKKALIRKYRQAQKELR